MQKLYTSPNAALTLNMTPGGNTPPDANGNSKLIWPRQIIFEKGFFRTDKEDEQAFIEASQDFREGRIVWLHDDNAKKTVDNIETVVYKIPEKTLKLMAKPDLYDYIEQRPDLTAPWTREQVLAENSPVKKEDLVAFAR